MSYLYFSFPLADYSQRHIQIRLADLLDMNFPPYLIPTEKSSLVSEAESLEEMNWLRARLRLNMELDLHLIGLLCTAVLIG